MKTLRREFTFDRLFGCQYRYVEYMLALWAVTWGIWILYGAVPLTERPAYLVMAKIPALVGIPREKAYLIWSIPEITLGVTLAFSLLRDWQGVRKLSVLGLTIFWLAVLLTLGLHNFFSTAMPTYTPLFFLHCLAYLRISGKSDAKFIRAVGG